MSTSPMAKWAARAWEAERLLTSAVDTFRDIAAIKGTSKRQKANSEIAANWLVTHGFAVEADGYIPGKGFAPGDADIADALGAEPELRLMRRQAE